MPNNTGMSPNGVGMTEKTLRRVSQFHRPAPEPSCDLWRGVSDDTTTQSNNNATCNEALGLLTTPTITQQQLAAITTPDSAVLGRMQELESTIALVKSSLENHATSYYSVASQIAELNARIGRMGVQDKPRGIGADYNEHKSTIDASDAPAHIRDATDDDYVGGHSEQEGGEEQYLRIQQMIDSLIKDADSALNSAPSNTRHSQLFSDDSMAGTNGVLAGVGHNEPALLATVPEFKRSLRPRSASRVPQSAPRPKSRSREYSLHAPPVFRPSSALGMTSKPSRGRRVKPTFPMSELDDPAEADGESDSERSTFDIPTRLQSRRNLYRSPRPSSSRSRRRKSSGHYSDIRSRQLDRYRSDTMDSHFSNSSETCVSPGNRVSREFHCLPADPQCMADSMCTPTRAAHMEFGDCVQACSFPDRGIHDFPHLEAVGQSHGDIAHRPRSAALRATHRAATYVNDCEGDTVAGSRRYWDRQSSSRILGQQDARRRSNTYVVEASPAASGYFDDEMLRRGSPARMNSNDTARELDWRHCDAQPTARIDPHQHCTDEPIEREQPRNERSLSLSSVGTMCRSDPKASNASVGLLSMVSLLYWTLLFTLGALMLDSFLCQVAGKRVMGTVDQIAHTGGDAGEISDDSVCTSSKGKQPEGSATGLTQTVGRIVRWCVEEDPGESGSNNYVHPRSLRARKASAMRGSFKFID